MAARKPSRPGGGRTRRRRRLLVAAGVTVVSIVAGYAIAWWVVQPPRPGGFYATPAKVDPRPGVLLRVEPVDSDVPRADAYRILYSSRDRADRPVAVSGLVLVPRLAAPDTGFPVVAWAHGTSGVARRCAPSLTPGSVTRNMAGTPALVDAGRLVVATDYPGLGTEGPHPYLIGSSEGRAVLDSVRAVRSHPDWHAGPRVAVWGHSQGGHAALFATQLAPDYAPELELVGTAVAAPATELSVLLRQDLTEPAGKVFGSMALTSWARLFPDARLSRVVRARDLPLVAAVAASCIETSEQGLVLLPVVSLMSKDFVARDLTATEPWASIIADNTVPAEGIDVPLFIAQGTADTVIRPAVSRDWVRRMCRQNPAVTYREYADKDHLSVLTAATADVVAWIGGRFTSQPAAKGCDAVRPS